jgi:hypothetical protein
VEKYSNDAQTTLFSAIADNIVTTLVVASAVLFPTTGNFRIRIDNEFMLVTGVSGTTFTVIRGIEGSTAAAHAASALVTQVFTAGGLEAGIVDPTQTILDGITGGSAILSQPVQAPTYKKVICYLDAYENDSDVPQTITYPTPFVNPPVFTVFIDGCSADINGLTLPSSMLASVTGFVVLEGY